MLLPPMKWNAWGDPAAAKPLSDGIRALLTQALGVSAQTSAELAVEDVQLRPSSLTSADIIALTAIVGAPHLSNEDQVRLLHAGGKSTLDLLRRATEAGRPEHTLPREWGDWATRAVMPSLRIPDFHMSSVSQAQ